MEYYPTILTFHIVFAGAWLINLVTNTFLKRFITNKKDIPSEKILVSLYLQFTNILGIIGSVGIIFSGILMVSLNPGYYFFQMTANHWLTTKQILMVILLLTIFLFIIPLAKKLRTYLESDLLTNILSNKESNQLVEKIYKLNSFINALVLINFILAITHRFFG